jgi:hypothetical protein
MRGNGLQFCLSLLLLSFFWTENVYLSRMEWCKQVTPGKDPPVVVGPEQSSPGITESVLCLAEAIACLYSWCAAQFSQVT